MQNTLLKTTFYIIVIYLLLYLFSGSAYAQDNKEDKKVNSILSIEAYDRLNKQPDTFLIDVRTRAEYQFTGHPTHAYLFPYMFMTAKLSKTEDGYEYLFNQENKVFVEEISKVFKKNDNLILICRDGKRSLLAGKKLIDNGFENVFSVKDGFEGKEFPSSENSDLDKLYKNLAKLNNIHGYKHRRHSGWQWWGLPWTYEMDPTYLYPPDKNQEQE